MEKRDIIVIIAAILVVFIMAMYVKPLVTGKPVKLIPDELTGLLSGIFGNNESKNQTNKNITDNKSKLNNTSENQNGRSDIRKNVTPISTQKIILPIPTWNGTEVSIETKNVTQGLLPSRPYPQDSPNLSYSFRQPPISVKTYTSFSGKYPIITNPFYVPANYWEIWYDAEEQSGLHDPQIVGDTSSFSYVHSLFKITLQEFSPDTKTLLDITTITPPGGLGTGQNTTNSSSGGGSTRPWKEKFFKGYGYYQLNIETRYINSFKIEIKLPDPEVMQNLKNLTLPKKENVINITLLMEGTIGQFISSYQGDLAQYSTFNSLKDTLSNQVKQDYSNQEIYSLMNTMKSSGISIDNFITEDVFSRLNQGSCKGYFTWHFKDNTRTTPWDVTFQYEGGKWKMNTLPIFKY